MSERKVGGIISDEKTAEAQTKAATSNAWKNSNIVVFEASKGPPQILPA